MQCWFPRSSGGRRHDLKRYFSATGNGPVGARNIINGKEWKKRPDGTKYLLATVIAEYHAKFLRAILAASKSTAAGALAALAVPPGGSFLTAQ